MKRFLTVLTVVLLAVVLCCFAGMAAAPDSYYLEEMDADIALPSWNDYYFLYPDMPEDNSDLNYLGMTAQEINDILIPNGILFDALHYDTAHEIAVQVNHEGTDDLNYAELSDVEQAAVIAATTMELEAMGYTVDNMEWVDGENACWLVMEFRHPDLGWVYQYHTSFDGRTLVFTASSALGAELTDEIRDVTAGMALGTVFRSGGSVIDEPMPSPYEPGSDDPAAEPDESVEDVSGIPDFSGIDVGRVVTGALIGFGAGVVVVVVIVVLMAVTGRKKKEKISAEE